MTRNAWVCQFLGRRIGPGSLESLLTRWGLCGGGLAVLVAATMMVPGLARNRAECGFGLAAALVLAVVMVRLGVLGGRFHDADARGELQSRSAALLSYPAGGLVLGLGGWLTLALDVSLVVRLAALLLVAAAALAILCLGVSIDLARSDRSTIDPGS